MLAFLASSVLGMALKGGVRAVAGNAVSNAKADWQAIPPKVKLGLAIALAVVILFFVHQHYAHKTIKTAYADGFKAAKAEDAAAAKKIEERARAIESKGRDITQKAEVLHDQAVRDLHSAYDAERMRPPPVVGVGVSGAALPRVPYPAGVRDGAAQGALPGLDSLSEHGFAVVPWKPLLDHGESCDVDRAKLSTLQNWVRAEKDAFTDSAKPGGAR